MAIGMARNGKSNRARLIGNVVLTALLCCADARGQETPPTPLSKECQPGNTVTASMSPIPRVATAMKERKQVRILAIGASVSQRRRNDYTALLEQILERAIKGLDVVIINRGLSGELAEDAAQRIKIEVALSEADLVLWQVGTNDAMAYVPLDRFKAAVTETVRWLKGSKIDVVLVGLQYSGGMVDDPHYQAIRMAIREIATAENVIVVRRYEAEQFLLAAEKVGTGHTPDEFEQTEAGYSCLAEYVARAISLSLFGKTLNERRP